MRYTITLISSLLIYANTFAQYDNKAFRYLLNINDSNTIISFRDSSNTKPSFYLNGKKIDINKTFINPQSIKNIDILSVEVAQKLYPDSAKGGIISIITKPRFKLLHLIEFLKKHKINYFDLDKTKVSINNLQIEDVNIQIDSKCQLHPIYLKKVGDKGKEINVIVGVSIYSN